MRSLPPQTKNPRYGPAVLEMRIKNVVATVVVVLVAASLASVSTSFTDIANKN